MLLILFQKINFMSLYTSKKAINNIPLAGNGINPSHSGNRKLKNFILDSNAYLRGLINNDVNYSALEQGMSNEAIKLIKVALNTIDELNEYYPGFSLSGTLDVKSYDFDEVLKIAVIAFQNWNNSLLNQGITLRTDGIIDADTLFEIDDKFFGDEFFDEFKEKYVGKKDNISVNFFSGFNEGKYIYQVVLQDGNKVQILLDNVLEGSVVRKDASDFDANYIRVSPSKDVQSEILNSPQLAPFLDSGSGNFSVKMERVNTALYFDSLAGPVYTDLATLNNEINTTPPKLFNDPDAKPYQVSEGENFSNIIQTKYYGGGDVVIENPYDNSVVFTLPERQMFPADKREQDARFQFYLNLLYYYNSKEETNGTVTEWGMKKDNLSSRYNVNHLDDVNIFNNNFSVSDADSGLPNYYRFLKRMEALNPNYKIQFDNQGKTSSFVADAGKKIIIPSRKFADTLYNFLNFRHNEMIESIEVSPENPGEETTHIASYIIGTNLANAISSMTGSTAYNDLIQQFKNDAIDLFNEVSDFFVDAYDFARALASQWPRGLGGSYGGGVGITWVYPFATDFTMNKRLWRKFTPESEFEILYNEEYEFKVGVDVATGFNLGLFSGHGKSKRGIGVQFGAGIISEVGMKTSLEYSFPIRKDETAFLVMIMAVFTDTMVKTTVDIMDYLNVINLSPKHYLSEMKIGISKHDEQWAAAQFGINSNGDPETNKNIELKIGSETDAQQNAKKSFLSIDNLLSNLPGIQISNTHIMGLECTIKYEYNDMPKIPDLDARIPSKTNVEFTFNTISELKAGALGNFFSRFLMSSPVTSGFNKFFDVVFNDNGTMIGVEFEGKRKVPANQLSITDTKLVGTNVPTTITNGTITYNNSPKWEWEAQLKLGTYTGDVKELCEPGTEAYIKLDLEEIKQMWEDGSNYNFTLENTLKVLNTFSFRKKVGYNSSPRKKLAVADKDLTGKVSNSFKGGAGSPFELQMTEDLLKNASKKKLGFDSGIALDLKFEVHMQDVLPILEFYIKKLYLINKIPPVNIGALRKRINDQRSIINRYIVKKEMELFAANPNPTEQQIIEVLGKKYYERLFSNDRIYADINDASSPFGLVKLLDTKYNTDLTTNTDYFEGAKNFFKSYFHYNSYFNGRVTREAREDYGVEDFLNAITYIISTFDISASLEAKAGVAYSAYARVGKGATVRLAIQGMAQINYEAQFYKNNLYKPFANADVLKTAQDEIHKTLIAIRSDKRRGITLPFPLLKNN